jgi:hypothetical protein
MSKDVLCIMIVRSATHDILIVLLEDRQFFRVEHEHLTMDKNLDT